MSCRISVKQIVLLGFLALWLPTTGQSPTRLGKEIEKAQQTASGMSADDPVWKSVNTEIGNKLSHAKLAHAAGYDYLAIEDLEKARGTLQAVKYMNDRKQNVGQNLDAFDEEWRLAHTEFSAHKSSFRIATQAFKLSLPETSSS